MASPTRILLADDHAIVRSGVRGLLDGQPDMRVVAEANDAQKTLHAFERERPEVVVLDLKMPGGRALDAIRTMCHKDRSVRIVVFTAFEQATDALLCFRAGAAGYVLKRSPEDELVTAIRVAIAGAMHVDGSLGAQISSEALREASANVHGTARLSQREAQVLELTALGHTSREISARLGVGVKTAETYRLRAAQKLGLRSRAEITRYARLSGALEPNPDDDHDS